jgi:hypothetical protein
VTSARRIDQPDDQSALRDAFLRALRRRVDSCASGTIVLPTGHSDAGEVARVLQALERARAVQRENR